MLLVSLLLLLLSLTLMLFLGSLQAIAGFATFAGIPGVVSVPPYYVGGFVVDFIPTVVAVMLFMSSLLLLVSGVTNAACLKSATQD
jgi:hypothetical protein